MRWPLFIIVEIIILYMVSLQGTFSGAAVMLVIFTGINFTYASHDFNA